MVASVGWPLSQASVRPVSVVVIDVLGHDAAQMTFAGDQDPVGALASDAANPSLRDRVGPRSAYRRDDDLDANRGEPHRRLQ